MSPVLSLAVKSSRTCNQYHIKQQKKNGPKGPFFFIA